MDEIVKNHSTKKMIKKQQSKEVEPHFMQELNENKWLRVEL